MNCFNLSSERMNKIFSGNSESTASSTSSIPVSMIISLDFWILIQNFIRFSNYSFIIPIYHGSYNCIRMNHLFTLGICTNRNVNILRTENGNNSISLFCYSQYQRFVRAVSFSIEGLALRQFCDQSTFGCFAVSLRTVVWHFINVDILRILFISNVLI